MRLPRFLRPFDFNQSEPRLWDAHLQAVHDWWKSCSLRRKPRARFRGLCSCVRPGTNLESKAAGGSGNGGPTQNEGVAAPAGQKDGCADGRKLQKWHLHSEVVTPAECAICTYLWMNIALSGNRVRMIQDSREKDEIKQATARVCL